MVFPSLFSDTIVIHGKRFPYDAPSPLVRYPGSELWVVTNAVPRYWGGKLEGWTQAFNVHPFDDIPTETMDWYRGLPPDRPVWLKTRRDDVLASRRFPLDMLRSQFPREPFGCTDDHVLAFAIAHAPKRIVLDGIGTTDDPLFQYLHRTLWHWIGYARGAGIDVVIPEYSCYWPREIYGYDRLGHTEMVAFNAAWTTKAKTQYGKLDSFEAFINRLARTSTLSPIYAESVIQAARSYFTHPQHDDNGG